MNNYSKYSAADRRTIDKIMTVKQWNEAAAANERINVKYGYVIPTFHGWDWKPTKRQLIKKYCFDPKF